MLMSRAWCKCFVLPGLKTEAHITAVSSEAWAKLRDWASVDSRGQLLLSGSVAHASLETVVCTRAAWFS